MKTVTITISIEKAETILREQARLAALYGALCDYATAKTRDLPRSVKVFADTRKGWLAQFVEAKRAVEAFGVEYEPTSEEEAMTVTFDIKNEVRKRRVIAGLLAVTQVSGGVIDYTKPHKTYRRYVHPSACDAAAERVVRRWKAMVGAPA